MAPAVHRANLRPRTAHLYSWLLGKHITPYLGGVELGRLDPPMIREWRRDCSATAFRSASLRRRTGCCERCS